MKTVSTSNVVIGLGNYGKEFNLTRHNVGFQTLDNLNSKNEKWMVGEHGLWCLNRHLNIILIKPTVGMNRSGIEAKDAIGTVNEDTSHVVVIHDDMDIDPGRIKISVGGSSGKHNGVQSVIDKIGPDFIRIRVGIGKPRTKEEGADFVLERFSGKERKVMNNAIQLAAEAVSWIVQDGVQKAMANFNKREV